MPFTPELLMAYYYSQLTFCIPFLGQAECIQMSKNYIIAEVGFQDCMVTVLPGMWQQSIPDIFWSDKVLRLCCLHY